MDENLVICHMAPLAGFIKGGIKRSILQQRLILDSTDLEYTTNPLNYHDILHVNVLDPLSIFFLLYSSFSETKTVITAHSAGNDFRGSIKFSNLLGPLVDRFLIFFYNRADLVLSPSEQAKKVLQRKGLKTEIKIISNGIEKSRLENEPYVEYDESKFHAVHIGHVDERKGFSDFISIAEEMNDIEFHWYGPKKIGPLIPRKIKRILKNPPDNVTFHGFIEDINEAFEIADVFFFPTKVETQGIPLIEAAYEEIPIVVRDIPVYKNWFIDGEDCLKAGSKEEFLEKIRKIQNQEYPSDMISNAKKKAERHTLDNISEDLITTYKYIYKS